MIARALQELGVAVGEDSTDTADAVERAAWDREVCETGADRYAALSLARALRSGDLAAAEDAAMLLCDPDAAIAARLARLNGEVVS